MMQRFVKLALLILFGTALSSCRSPQSTPSDTLVVALGAQPPHLDPRFATDANGMRVVGLIFNSLVRVGPDLQIQGDAAQSWTLKDATYTFHLHPNLRFSNGRPVTQEDIDFSFQQFQDSKSPFASALQDLEKVTVNGDNKNGFLVHLKLKAFSGKFLTSDLPAVKILPRTEILKDAAAFAAKPFGTGSLALEALESNRILLKSVTDHPLHVPKYKFLEFKVIRDEFTRFQRTLKGSIDIAQAEIAPSKVAEFEKRPEQFQTFKYPGLSMTYILLNLKDPILSQREVRWALAQSIHREEIIKYKLEGLALEATSLLTPTNPFFNSALTNIPYNLAAARAVLEKYKLIGHEIKLKSSNNLSAMDNARVLAYQLSQSGLKVGLQSFEWGTFYADIQSGNFQLATMRWIGVLDPDIYRLAFHSSEFPPGRNRGRYQNAELDRLVEQGLKISDESKRREIYNRAQEIIHQDVAIIPLWYDQQVAIVHHRVQGFKPWQASDFYPFLYVSKP